MKTGYFFPIIGTCFYVTIQLYKQRMQFYLRERSLSMKDIDAMKVTIEKEHESKHANTGRAMETKTLQETSTTLLSEHLSLCQKLPFALELLTVCTYLAPEKIPHSILLDWFKNAHPELDSAETLFSNLTNQLSIYSLIRIEETGNITIPQPVQTVLHQQHLEKIDRERYDILLKMTHAEFSKETSLLEDELRKKDLLPHLQSLIKYYDLMWPKEKYNLFLADIIRDVGHVLELRIFAFKDATPYFTRALEIRQKLQDQSPEMGLALMDLGLNYRFLRELKKAQQLLEESLIILEKSFGEDDPRIVDVLVGLGHTYRNLYEYDRSLSVLKHALEINKKIYGEDHLRLATNFRALSLIYVKLNDFENAFTVAKQALKIFEKSYGGNHLTIGDTFTDLGVACRELMDFNQSQYYLERALDMYKIGYGKDHCYVAKVLYDLGQTYAKQGEYEKSKEALEQALRINEREYGADHTLIAINLTVLGNTYRLLKDFEKSSTVLKRALKINEHAYNEMHPEIFLILEKLVETYRDMGDLDQLQLYTARVNSIKTNNNAKMIKKTEILTQLEMQRRISNTLKDESKEKRKEEQKEEKENSGSRPR